MEFAKDEMSESYTCTNLHGNNQWAKHGTMTNATAVKMCQCHYSLGQNTESYEGAMALVRRVAAEKLDGFIGSTVLTKSLAEQSAVMQINKTAVAGPGARDCRSNINAVRVRTEKRWQ